MGARGGGRRCRRRPRARWAAGHRGRTLARRARRSPMGAEAASRRREAARRGSGVGEGSGLRAWPGRPTRG
jgi:hypothetical protein